MCMILLLLLALGMQGAGAQRLWRVRGFGRACVMAGGVSVSPPGTLEGKISINIRP